VIPFGSLGNLALPLPSPGLLILALLLRRVPSRGVPGVLSYVSSSILPWGERERGGKWREDAFNGLRDDRYERVARLGISSRECGR
jgi:hypothetical protein